MLALAHVGITLGAATMVSGACCYIKERRNNNTGACPHPASGYSNGKSAFNALASMGDIRFLLIGALLPDIIDKPLGLVFFPQIFHNSRIIGHTLFFLLLLIVATLLFYRKNRQTVFLMLSFGVGMHLVLDFMWKEPHTLLWPAYGFMFYYRNLEGWLAGIFHNLVTEPVVYIGEILGAIILLWFALMLVRTKNIWGFIKHGSLN